MDKQLQGKIFLIEPIEELRYKKIIVYSDTPENARIAGNQKYHPHNQSNELNFSDEKLVYLNPNYSMCKEIKPKIISIDNKSKLLEIEYEGVKYELVNNKPVEHIGGGLI
ncbi:MAG: hypothetical protein ABI370_07625 [Gammaproteobacteria bacterium]